MKQIHGRFRQRLDPSALKFSSSLNIDKRLYREDIRGSLAHVAMLARQGIVSARDARKISAALRTIERDITNGNLVFGGDGRYGAEDVHMFIEQRLIEKVGPLGGQLHTARSRNDQIALDERLYLQQAIAGACKLLRRLQRECLALAKRNNGVIMPGYTHLQRAQPILFAHHIVSYVSMLERDHERFNDCLARVRCSPLGAAALAGTSFPIDRKFTARKLGFHGIVENSIDAVSDRDVHIEAISACAIAMMHLSRFSEELILWSSSEWNFIEIGDAFTTGSSIMPQKKNPDMAELVRGKTGRVYGDLVALLTVMKGLPLAYNRDMQEDKEPMFDAFDTLTESLTIFAGMLTTVRVNSSRFLNELQGDTLLATELADYLVRKGLPFRRAHAVTGSIVEYCLRKKMSLRALPLTTYRSYSKLFENTVYDVLDVKRSLTHKNSAGSTSPKEVAKAIRNWKKKLKEIVSA